MDERVHVEEVLGIKPEDAHIYRNLGRLIVEDTIRSANLTTFFQNYRNNSYNPY